MAKKIKIIRRAEHLPKPSHVHAMAEINGQTARGAAIAGTAYLDLLLRGALERQMRPYAQIRDLLFENRGALQDFSARIHVAFALKVIGSGAYLDLGILREIRNAFAHSADAFDFDREDIAKLCADLWYPRRIQYANTPAPKTPRETFIRAVELLADGLIEPVSKEGALPLPSSFILLGPPWPPHGPQSSPRKPPGRSSGGRPVASQRS